MKHFRTRLRIGLALPVLAAVAATAVTAMRWSDTLAGTIPPYSIDFHTISSGGSSLRNGCFHLNGTVGQAAHMAFPAASGRTSRTARPAPARACRSST